MASAQGATPCCSVGCWASRSSASLSHRRALFTPPNFFLGPGLPCPDVRGLCPRGPQQVAGGPGRTPALALSVQREELDFSQPRSNGPGEPAFLWHHHFRVITSLMLTRLQ